jgi:CheY-like chemotaxis protein
VELNTLVGAFAPLLEQALGEGIQLQLDLADETVCSYIDPTHLENALLNLAVNARDAMERNGALTIRVRAVEDVAEPFASITVSDTGSGMAPEVAARIFEPFYTTKEVGQGTGLGLSQVYGFVTQSGGAVTVESQPGQGSMFALKLPLSREPATVTKTEPAVEWAPGSERLLVVEDNAEVLNLCVELLESMGYVCDTATSGPDALRKLELGGPYDLLFSDVVMPGTMSGIQLARLATQGHPKLKVLLTSGYVGENALHAAHEFEVIDKPYEEAALARRLQAILGERPYGPQARAVGQDRSISA